MSTGPVFIIKGDDAYQCDLSSESDTERRYDCTKELECDGLRPAVPCGFKPVEGSPDFVAVESVDSGSVKLVYDTLDQTVATSVGMPESRALIQRGKDLRGVTQFDWDYYRQNLGQCGVGMECVPEFGRTGGESPEGSSRLLAPALVRAGNVVVPFVTVPAKSPASNTVLKVTEWMKAKDEESDLVTSSRAVVVYHVKGNKAAATKLALEYIDKGIYAMTKEVGDDILDCESSGNPTCKPNKNFMAERARTLTVAYLPTEDIGLPPLDDPDPVRRAEQNNERIPEIASKAFPDGLDEAYRRYVASFGLKAKADGSIEG